MSTLHVKIEPDELSWKSLTRALRSESDGQELRRDLAKLWRAPAAAAATAAKAAIRGAPAQASTHAVSLRAAIAKGVRAHVYTGAGNPARGKFPGVAVKWHRSPMGAARRGKRQSDESILWRAGQLLNRGRVWQHPVFGHGPNVTTGVLGAKGWFDRSVDPYKPAMAGAVRLGYDLMVARISRKSKG